MALGQRWGVIVAFVTYLLFFCEGFNRWSSSESAKKVFTEEFQAKQEQARHICSFCGATEKSHPELSFRYCSPDGKMLWWLLKV